MRFFEEPTLEVMAFEIEDITTSAADTTEEYIPDENEGEMDGF